ncbi:MAG: sulfatase-like hydrolase/transferase [Planctomycetota bacterium]
MRRLALPASRAPLWLPILLALFASCGGGEPHEDGLGSGGDGVKQPHVSSSPTKGLLAAGEERDLIVLSIDTLRADRLPFYGAERATGGDAQTPWSLAWMAAQGTVYDQTWAPAGMTLPSFSSFWTGLEPLEHGGISNHRAITAPTFPMELAKAGWRGHLSVSNRVLGRGSGVQRGFKTGGVFAKEKEPLGPASLLARTAEDIAAGHRVLVWGHFMAPHQPYEPRAPHRHHWSTEAGVAGTKDNLIAIHQNPSAATSEVHANLRALYDEEILTANDFTMELLQGLEKQYQDAGRGSLLENAVVVFMSDHGEELGHHEGYYMHAKSLYSGVIQVPLVILGQEWPAGARIEEPISLNDVLPMVLQGKAPTRDTYVAAYRQGYYSIRDARWTLVHNPGGQTEGPAEPPEDADFGYPEVALFDRLADPMELVDVSRENPEVTRRLLDSLHAWYLGLEIAFDTSAMTPDQIAQVQETGYAGTDDPEEGIYTPWTGADWK